MTQLNSFEAHTYNIERLRYLSNGYLGSVSDDKSVKLWNTTTWNLIFSYTGHSNYVFDVAYLGNDLYASGSSDNTIQIWQLPSGLMMQSINVAAALRCLQLLPNGNLASGDTSSNI